MITYLPPKQEDFEMLERSKSKPKTNMKGEAKKYDMKKSKEPASFPLKTMEVNEEMLEYN